MRAHVKSLVLAALVGLAYARISPSETTQGYLRNYGIGVEEHFATTDDGYILRMFRLPRPDAPVVLLQHGILASSWCWLVNTPEKSIGIVLWNMGYDVWLTNSRGNIYSRNHTSMDPLFNKEFWDYSFDDMGNFDVFANVKKVLAISGKPTLTFMGWSQGSTQMFIAASGSQRSFLESHVNLFIALSPVSFMKSQQSLLLRLVTAFRLGAVVKTVFPFGFLDQKSLPAFAQFLCTITNGLLCKITVDAICGTSAKDDVNALENLTAHFPAGTSVKDLEHYEQFIIQERFGRYDYGFIQNVKRYQWPTPPDYHLKGLSVKTALFMASDDDLADFVDTARLQSQLKGNSNLVFAKEYQGYSHVSWLVSQDFAWFADVLPLLHQYNPLPSSVIDMHV